MDEDNSLYEEYCEEFALLHPIRENGTIVGYRYPNGMIKLEGVDFFDSD